MSDKRRQINTLHRSPKDPRPQVRSCILSGGGF